MLCIDSEAFHSAVDVLCDVHRSGFLSREQIEAMSMIRDMAEDDGDHEFLEVLNFGLKFRKRPLKTSNTLYPFSWYSRTMYDGDYDEITSSEICTAEFEKVVRALKKEGKLAMRQDGPDIIATSASLSIKTFKEAMLVLHHIM